MSDYYLIKNKNVQSKYFGHYLKNYQSDYSEDKVKYLWSKYKKKALSFDFKDSALYFINLHKLQRTASIVGINYKNKYKPSVGDVFIFSHVPKLTCIISKVDDDNVFYLKHDGLFRYYGSVSDYAVDLESNYIKLIHHADGYTQMYE